jgi:hypothetical protein
VQRKEHIESIEEEEARIDPSNRGRRSEDRSISSRKKHESDPSID